MSAWDVMLLTGFVALVAGVAALSAPLSAIVAGALLMAAGMLGARAKVAHPVSSEPHKGKG